MSRPPARSPDLVVDSPVGAPVDAGVCARAGSTIVRRFSGTQLPRLREAGGHEGAAIEANLQFSQFDGRPAVTGELHGKVVLTCQRCMQPVAIDIDDTFQVLLVDEERSDEPGGYEPVVANASRLDLGWLVEEQVLLALPLVPMHESEDCNAGTPATVEVTLSEESGNEPDERAGEPAGGVTHQPFQNLRDLMRNKR